MFTFQYRPLNKNEWSPKARMWKTFLGALKAGNKWAHDMDAEGCPVQIRYARIVDNAPVVMSPAEEDAAGRR